MGQGPADFLLLLLARERSSIAKTNLFRFAFTSAMADLAFSISALDGCWFDGLLVRWLVGCLGVGWLVGWLV